MPPGQTSGASSSGTCHARRPKDRTGGDESTSLNACWHVGMQASVLGTEVSIDGGEQDLHLKQRRRR